MQLSEQKLELRVEEIASIESELGGHVFHVTRHDNWPLIVSSGEILPNTDGQFSSPFGSENAYFRRRGCVSVFDYRTKPDIFYRLLCSPLLPAFEEGGISILFLKECVHGRLIAWDQWKDEGATERIVAHVEAGHQGPIPLSEIERVVHLRLIKSADSIAAKLEAAAQRRHKAN